MILSDGTTATFPVNLLRTVAPLVFESGLQVATRFLLIDAVLSIIAESMGRSVSARLYSFLYEKFVAPWIIIHFRHILIMQILSRSFRSITFMIQWSSC